MPKGIEKECGIVNLDDIQGPGTLWVCYRNLENDLVEYVDPFGLIMPHEIYHYLITSGKKIIHSQDELQNRDCSLSLLVFLLLERKTKRKKYFRCHS